MKQDPADPTTWIDDVILAAQARGEFEALPGTGKPIPGAGTRDDDLWWVRSWVERNRQAATTPDKPPNLRKWR
ncbi:MAG TPA: DnaJ family domain-containing protein [Acidimicrobiia bacterium]